MVTMTYLYFLKGAFKTSLISYDLVLVVLNNVKNNPRFWTKGLQNKWLFEVKIEFSDELFKDLSEFNEDISKWDVSNVRNMMAPLS